MELSSIVECYDIGGTKISAAIIENGKIVKKIKRATKKENFVDQIVEISKSFTKEYPNVRKISIGVPGPVKDGILLCSPPLHLYKSINIPEKLGANLNKKIYVDNDLNIAVRAEQKYGHGRIFKNFCLTTISTGIGVGVVLEGKILGNQAGEVGHNVIERDLNVANKCSCGNLGCWVAMSSGYGIQLTTKKAFGKDLTNEDFFSLFDTGNRKVKRLVEKLKEYNAHGFGDINNAYAPEAIVVMGSVGLNQFDKIIPLKENLKKFTINPLPEIFKTNLLEDIGLIGAYCFAEENEKRV